MAQGQKQVRIKMKGAVVGEDGKIWQPGTTHTVSESFAREMFRRDKAVEASAKADAKASAKTDAGEKDAK